MSYTVRQTNTSNNIAFRSYLGTTAESLNDAAGDWTR